MKYSFIIGEAITHIKKNVVFLDVKYKS